MQLRIVHRTEFDYDDRASASYNQARMTPSTTPEQIVIHERLDVTPSPWTYPYTDYFGTQVIAFEIADPHEEMTVVATSTVQVNRPAPPAPSTPWDAYDDRAIADRWTEYLVRPELVAPPEDLVARVREIAASAALPGEAARAVVRLVHDEIRYVPGATDAASTARQAWEQRTGAVQDMVHLTIGALRAIGIPARYVSGYVHPVPEPVIGETVAGDSRAWVEWWDDGWHALDPSTDTAPDDRYVAVGFGRDYEDVPPLRGIYSGTDSSEMSVSVEMTRLA
ncbi:transglutaminase family protein [Nocardioides sambongensis]|uniref:transglutaminase family protein n=1 Tax=Nocardioides sambongensis TaxID=2589074 RepID=UPI00112C0B1B|nr:transglutaminase family protein [Nocardioides sambongensis]